MCVVTNNSVGVCTYSRDHGGLLRPKSRRNLIWISCEKSLFFFIKKVSFKPNAQNKHLHLIKNAYQFFRTFDQLAPQ